MTHHSKYDILADPRALLNHRLGGAELTLAQIETLLACHADIAARTNQLEPEALASYRTLFERAGLGTLMSHFENKGWLQFGLTAASGAQAHLYAALGDFLDRSKNREQIKNAFFAHNPPGIRLRLQVDPFRVASLAHPICDTLKGWRASGLIEAYRREIYEPETALFGGKNSMDHVHALFSEETDFWLQFHATEDNRARSVPTALILLHHIFSGLEIVDWEDLVVWEKMRQMTFGSASTDGYDEGGDPQLHAQEIVALWSNPDAALVAASPALTNRIDTASKKLTKLAKRWKTHCFDSGDTTICVGDAAARCAAFLFNRAGLSSAQQRLIADALATRKVTSA